jgi:hypothetical protein
VNDGGNFCEKCGVKLSSHEIAATTEGATKPQVVPVSSTSSINLENAKKISKMYWGYFTTILRSPFSRSKHIGKEQFMNGIITIILYALFIPLMMYFGLKDLTYIESPFLNIVIKPAFAYAIFILLVATFLFFALKLGKVPVGYKDVAARFGAFLVPFVALFVLAFLMAILQMKLFLLLLFIGFIASIFTVPVFVIGSFKNNIHQGLDAVYGTVLTYLATFITLGIMGKALFAIILQMVQEHIFSLFF